MKARKMEEEIQTLDAASGIDALTFLMEQNGLNQSDFPEIGSQGVMSELLNGKRQLNINQIKKLSKRFHVSPATFIDDSRGET